MTESIADLVQVVAHEREGRDRGWWDQMAGCYHSRLTSAVDVVHRHRPGLRERLTRHGGPGRPLTAPAFGSGSACSW